MCFRPPSVGKPLKCTECGAVNPSIAKVCVRCKAPLPEPEPAMIACPRCKALNPETAKVCASCGLTEEEAMAAAKKPRKCPSCGTTNPGTRTSCLKCQTELPFE